MFRKKRLAIAPEGTYFEITRPYSNDLRLILLDTDNGENYWLEVSENATDKYVTKAFLDLINRYEIAQRAEERVGIYREFPRKEEN